MSLLAKTVTILVAVNSFFLNFDIVLVSPKFPQLNRKTSSKLFTVLR